MNAPWICPSCGAGVRGDQVRCCHPRPDYPPQIFPDRVPADDPYRQSRVIDVMGRC